MEGVVCHFLNWHPAPGSGTLRPYTDLISKQPLMRFYFPLLTAVAATFFYGWVGVQTMNAAKATVNAHQERQAEALCKVDPAYCGTR
jgi:hypothetical protein